MPQPIWSTWPANVATGPLVSGPGSKDPRYKKFLCSILIPEKLLQVFEICKMHRIFPVCQKNVYDLSKCSEK
jgi:hypothetical protein